MPFIARRLPHLADRPPNNGLLGLFADTDGAREESMIDLNVRAPTLLAKRLLPALMRTRGGIINVASTAAFQPRPWMAAYYATKAYLLSFSEAIAEELAPHGVRVMALCPGPTRSGFQDQAAMQRSGHAAHATAERRMGGRFGLARGSVAVTYTCQADSTR